MPFKSEKQRRYMWMAHSDIAEAWAHGRHSKRKSSRSKRRGSRS